MIELADTLRVATILLGGVTFGAAIPIIRGLVLRRKDEPWIVRGLKLFQLAHALMVLYVTGTLIERFGANFTWRAPTALLLFTIKAAMFICLYRALHEEYQRPGPKRRTTDAPPLEAAP